MSLSDKLKELTGSSPGLPCGVAKVKEFMSEEDYSALESVLSIRYKSGGISNRKIQALLISEGYDISYASLTLHRRRECRCFMGKNGIFRAQNNSEKEKQL